MKRLFMLSFCFSMHCLVGLAHASKYSVKECKDDYVKYLRGGRDSSDCLDSLSKLELSLLLEQTTIELGYLTPDNLYLFSRTERCGFHFRGEMAKLYMSQKSACMKSMWKALFLFKK